MTAKTMRGYTPNQQPAQSDSARDWLQKELQKLQASMKDMQAAIVQLQQNVSGL